MIKNFSLTKMAGIIFSPLLVLILVLFFPLAKANADSQHKQSSPSIICESKNNKVRRCRFDTRYGVVLIRQLSNSPCRGNWTYGRGYIEVRNGCRAEFRAGRSHTPAPHESIICESRDGRSHRCRFDTSHGVILIRQLSRSSCRGNWTYGRGYIEVWNGCRAEFTRGRR